MFFSDFEIFFAVQRSISVPDKHCKLQNISRGKKSKEKKVKIKTQNEQTQTWIYGTKHVKNSHQSQEETVQSKQPHELSVIFFLLLKVQNMSEIQLLLLNFFEDFLEWKKKLSGCFSHTEYLQNAQSFSDQFQPVNYVFGQYVLSYLRKSDAES